MPHKDDTQPMTAYVTDDEAQKLLASIDGIPVSLRRLYRLVKQLLEERAGLLKENGELQREVNMLRAAAQWPLLQGEYDGASVDTPEQMKTVQKKKRPFWAGN